MESGRVRVGYEHHYTFSIDDGLLSRFNYEMIPRAITYLIEFRATFTVKTRDGQNQIIGFERYKQQLFFQFRLTMSLSMLLDYRLEEYWMTEEEIQTLDDRVADFAAQTLADPKHASRRVIPIAINIDVCTVQQDGESIGGAHERAIRVDKLVPISTWDRERTDPYFSCFLYELKRFRVEGVGRAEVCDICRKDPKIGAQMSVMPCCNRAFHSNCLSRWILDKHMCPYCNSPPELDD